MNTNQSNQQQPQQIIVVQNQKSAGLAIVLALFFGPLGLFYATVSGGAIMCVISIIVGIFTMGIGLIFTQIACVIWAVMAVNGQNAAAQYTPPSPPPPKNKANLNEDNNINQ